MTGIISLVGAGPGAVDMLTLRALDRIRSADVIYFDRLITPQILALARPQTEMIFVGKEVGAHSWPQDRINAVIVTAAQAGQRVVRLKSGDPSVFGRACEELAAARNAGIAIEIVPGVTAASAAAASLGRPLTERGETDHLVIATGTCRPGDEAPDWGALLRPGTTLALYMAMGKLAEIETSLIGTGLAADTVVEIVADASTGKERQLATTLGRMRAEITANGLRGPAVVFVRRPKSAAAALALIA
jgi:uroporphyrin-III C-methyltransferase